MKSKWIGLILVIAVIGAVIGYSSYSRSTAATELSGFVGGEKVGFLEDEEVQKVLQKKYHYVLNYSKAGSLDMVSADLKGRDYLWPSSQTALELYRAQVGKPKRSEVIFNTPIVIYTWKPVVEALDKQGLIGKNGDAYTVDLAKLVKLVEDGTSWSSIGMDQLYGNITVSSTDPVKSNSGNMFAALLANTLAGGVANESNVDAVLPTIRSIFEQSGYMESSSADIFSSFLKMGMGSKPMVVGYENQLLEFAAENPDTWEQVKGDIVMLYPIPTLWSSHVYIAMDDQASGVIDALQDQEIQKLAWERHGFRTGVAGDAADLSAFEGIALEKTVTQVGQMPSYRTMEKIMQALSR